ncbi:uncharacterized protein L201_004011 [Kwoniella dendrophila CBS 6074]|uniref:Extracellular membrane protein CFEM domain-containing protein n=1 Tax=Kwoniella dendrophila CBS 6074 TaxID=1295534 RepID=A0AAX4JW37_9TREE
MSILHNIFILFISLMIVVSASPLQEIRADYSGVDEECVLACSHWSEFANQFLGCLCIGKKENGILGNESISNAASFCLGCITTPGKIKEDLGNFLGLCQVQKQNETAYNAINFSPIGYSTSNDKSKAAVTSDVMPRIRSPIMDNMAAQWGLGILLIGLGGWTVC